MEKMLERLEKIDPDTYQNLEEVIERHTEFTEKLNIVVDSIPLLLSHLMEKNKDYYVDIVPDIFNCKTSEEILELVKKELE